MKLFLLFLLFCSLQSKIQSQDVALVSNYALNNYYDPIVSGDSVYIAVRTKNGSFEIHCAALSSNTVSRIYYPPVKQNKESNFTIDKGYIYYHITSALVKIDMRTNKQLWETPYSSKWGAQWEPVILDNYAVCVLDDMILVVDKNSGRKIQEIKGRGFEDGVSLSENKLIYTKEGGRTIAIDLKTGEQLWSMDVGDEAGYGSVTDGDNIYLPSWDPKFYSLNKTTGKTQWVLDLKKIKNGCGSGFEEAPVLVGNNLYAVHRDFGLFIINKVSGEVIRTLDFGVRIVENAVEYKNHLIFSSNKYLHVFSIDDNKETKRIPLPQEVVSEVVVSNHHLVLGQGNQHGKNGVVLVYDLKKVITE